MPQRQDYLKCICDKRYKRGHHIKPNDELFKASNLLEEITNVYERLGGLNKKPPLRVGKYDIELEDFIIELDEENHFNRYRLQTLSSTIYTEYNNFDISKYQTFCISNESQCRTYGKFWSTPSSDKQFGGSSENRVLGNSGASRWKQRAFYDFIKDAHSIVIGIPVIRISIYELYNGYPINWLIKKKKETDLLQCIHDKYLNVVSCK